MLLFANLGALICIDPVSPDFEYREGLPYIGGFAGSTPGSAFVSINVSAKEFGIDVVSFVEGASVILAEEVSGPQVVLNEIGQAYAPPADFAVVPGP